MKQNEQLERQRRSDEWRRQKEAEQMQEINNAKQAQKQRAFYEEHKISLREIDRLKEEAMEKLKAQQERELQMAEEERRRHAPKIKIIGDYDDVDAPSLQKSQENLN